MALVEISNHDTGVRELRLNDPGRRNAMSVALGDELRAAVTACVDDHVPVVVLTGAGTAFCAGADLPELFGDVDQPAEQMQRRLREYYRTFLDVHRLAVPTIAAVNGPAVGAGLNLALACDIRVAGPTATFGATFARIGLHPGGGCTWFLVQQIGYARAVQTLLRGQTLDATQAAAAGLADGPFDDPLGHSLTVAGEIAATEPALASEIKATARMAAAGAPFDQVLEAETIAQAASTRSERLRAWVDRFR